jgi:hypothetical protein
LVMDNNGLHIAEGITLNGQPIAWADEPEVRYIPEPHCFVCGRHTDHVGEHDDLVVMGFAQYDDFGQVTYDWDRGLAMRACAWGFRSLGESIFGHLGWDAYPAQMRAAGIWA